MVGSVTLRPRALSTTRITSCETGRSIDVRRASVAALNTTLATFGCMSRSSAVGSRSVDIEALAADVVANDSLQFARYPSPLPA